MFGLTGCNSNEAVTEQAGAGVPQVTIKPADEAPPATATGGFDGKRAYQHVSDLVAIGPHSAGTDGGRKAQDYIVGKLQNFGCMVDQQTFRATATPVGDVNMKNIVAKIPGASPD